MQLFRNPECKTGNAAQLVEWLSSMQALGFIPTLKHLGVMVHACNHSIQEDQKFKIILSYIYSLFIFGLHET